MQLLSWLRDQIGGEQPPSARRRRAKRRPEARFRPRLESMEIRCVPSTVQVTSAVDGTQQGTLRYAVATAGNGDTIALSAAVAQAGITLTQGELLLTQQNLTIKTVAAASGPTTISGGNTFRIFEVAAGASVTLNNLTITGGNAETTTVEDPTNLDPHEGRGGGIVVDEGGSLAMTGCNVTNNIAAAISNPTVDDPNHLAGGLGGGIADYGTLTMNNCAVTNNQALYTYGGGIAVFSGAPFSANSSASLTIRNSTVSGNTAAANGGGITGVSSTVNVLSCDVTGNTASLNAGGGLNNHGGTMTISGSRVTGNTAGFFGGGISAGDNYLAATQTTVPGTLTITGSDISGNTADYGGGIDNSSALTLNNSTVTNNSAHYLAYGWDNGQGGGIFNEYSGTATLKNVVLSGNEAAYGGGINNSGTVTLTNSTVTNNAAHFVAYGYLHGNGGGIQSYGTLTLKGCQMSMNTAPETGGAIIAYGTNTIDSCAITNNSASSAGGMSVGGSTTISNSEISGNTANNGDTAYPAGSGGGVIVSGTTLISKCDISHNSAVSDGGAIEFGYGILTVANSTLTNDSAGEAGAVYVGGGSATFINCQLTGNSATGNAAQGWTGVGGAVDLAYGTLSFQKCAINGNSADLGAGIFMSGGTLWITGSTKVSNNTAVTAGGGLYVARSQSAVTVNDHSSIVDNTAPAGSGNDVYIEPKFSMYDSDVVFYLEGSSKIGDIVDNGILFKDKTSKIDHLVGNAVIPI